MGNIIGLKFLILLSIKYDMSLKKTYKVIFSREIDTKRITLECTVNAKTFGEAERFACKEISGNYFKAALTGDHANDDMKSANYIIDIYIVDDTEVLNEHRAIV